MKFETDYIEKLAKVLADTGLTEISLEDGEQAITLRKDVVVAPVAAPVANIQAPAVAPAAAQAQTPTAVEPAKKGTPITSPMVGTFYKSPSPDADAFVSVGDNVKPGDVVCIVEAMKMMNEIKSEISGKVVDIVLKTVNLLSSVKFLCMLNKR